MRHAAPGVRLAARRERALDTSRQLTRRATVRRVQRLKKLNTQHKAACRLKAEGRSIKYISDELGVAVRTLHVWFSDDIVKEEVARLTDEVEHNFVQRLSQAGMQALDHLVEVATDASNTAVDSQGRTRGIEWNTRLEMLNSILDRIPQGARIEHQAEAIAAANGGENSSIQVLISTFQSMPDEQLAGLFQEWLQSGAIDASTGKPALTK